MRNNARYYFDLGEEFSGVVTNTMRLPDGSFLICVKNTDYHKTIHEKYVQHFIPDYSRIEEEDFGESHLYRVRSMLGSGKKSSITVSEGGREIINEYRKKYEMLMDEKFLNNEEFILFMLERITDKDFCGE